MSSSISSDRHDVVLIGGGIMSATLGALLRSADPSLRIQVYEAAPELAGESSHGWNNAGTGHAGLCEVTYTPDRRADGTVDAARAIGMFARFERSKQFWAYAAAAGLAGEAREFIRPVPHVSFVQGEAQVSFLRARHAALTAHPFFASQRFTTDPAVISHWAPLLMEGRDSGEAVAATRTAEGTDVNFGLIARRLLEWLGRQPGCGVATGRRVTGLARSAEGWQLDVRDIPAGSLRRAEGRRVFVGAGGGTLPILQRARIPEAEGYAAFPIGGQWLACENPAVVSRHAAKVYGQAVDEAPAMGGPHLDLRMIDGRQALLFGPFATLTTRFLRGQGSPMDLPSSLRPHNLGTLCRIGAKNLPLLRYLARQAAQSMGDRMRALRAFYPAAEAKDWRLVEAGIRVQTIKPADAAAGRVNFGTEILTTADGTLSALLGASPGASVSADVALTVIRRSFPEIASRECAPARLDALIPTWNQDLAEPAAAAQYLDSTSERIGQILGLGGGGAPPSAVP